MELPGAVNGDIADELGHLLLEQIQRPGACVPTKLLICCRAITELEANRQRVLEREPFERRADEHRHAGPAAEIFAPP
eukprot:1093322-Rhodomonas_salina.1